ncbi:hypothetical protein B7R54_06530 [Subtercola boreus]|uniref:Secreted protein n=1 Tax=Subtercola boreus TaxID=120213 RepID=A0A3E0VHG6_9MICO|nr:hypothetical protein [Subtercola boreus]RFA08918.1 hypothetical protein B7R54_06530 [Subtercola boreus]TQL54098.1 hypothetical protein FB464_1628 [Subtercola boreus]
MNRRSIKTTAAVVCVAAATIGLGLAGATPATASPVAPTATTSSDQSFIVPSGSLPGARSVEFLGEYKASSTTDNIAAYGVYFTCDDGATVLVEGTSFWPGDVRYGRLDGAQFYGTIPIAEVGHTCVIHGVAPTGRALTFEKPWNKPDESDQPRLQFASKTIVKSASGGL